MNARKSSAISTFSFHSASTPTTMPMTTRAASAFFTLRAVWQWERTRLVVTTEKVYLLNGTLHRRSKAVRLQLVDAVEVDQSLVGQLFGYGTVVVGPLKVGHIARPSEVCNLVERLAS